MSELFSSFRLRSITFPNRIVMAPMCMYSAADGLANEWHRIHYGARAVGGVGLILAEATAVTADGRISPADLGLWNDAQVEALKPIVEFIRARGVVPGVQLAHAGRKGGRNLPWLGNGPLPDGAWGPLPAPSAIPFESGWQPPAAVDEAAMAELVESFAGAARRAFAAGFQVAELHMAHGYLLHQFLSPLANRRTDEYGGSLENRARFPLRVARAVRAVWPAELPLFARLSVVDWLPGGLTLEDSVQVAGWLKEAGVDLVDCSSSGIAPGEQIPRAPGYHAPLSRAMRERAGIASAVVGEINEPALAEKLLANGSADLVLLGLALLRDPYWARRAAQDLGAENGVAIPRQYLRAVSHPVLGRR